ncbi:MAG: amino acid permease [Candidatus Peribacteria bacterium]|nr:amino acid permease [Candidatus Peribacteria bacterium]
MITHSENPHKHLKLGQLPATAICGNDIMSSCLYVSGIAILFAGVYAPLVLLCIGFVLYLYKKVYTEVVEALPVNGGAYNCLLNGTSKTVAAVAGIMTFLSYIATAVISAKVGVEYLGIGIEHATQEFMGSAFGIPVIPITIAVLFLFALLVISGVKDSAKVAFGIFSLHILTLIGFLIFGVLYFAQGGTLYFASNIAQTTQIISKNGGLFMTVYLAFSASLLGVSGFESSANFVEEQEKGVFRKTLRNMLLGVVIFNPLIAYAVLNVMPYSDIVQAKDFLLANAAQIIGGKYLLYLVSVDAFLVLCGAVLTAYIGVSGLLHRMSGDHCIPSWFARENKRNAFPRIVIGFFLLSSSILLITHGDLLSLAGVYTIAFLGVMSLFALGNLILKETRTELKRTYQAPVSVVIIALLATLFGMFGNIRIDPNNLSFFEIYFIPTLLLVLCVIYQDYIMKFLLRITSRVAPGLHRYLRLHFSDITEGKFVAFIHDVSRLRPILDYIDRNEVSWNITLIHCKDKREIDPKAVFTDIHDTLPVLQKAGFYSHFHIDLQYEDEEFGPGIIDKISRKLNVHKNRILIGSIHETHSFSYEDLGGVRIIYS